jgi:hypothetical protein
VASRISLTRACDGAFAPIPDLHRTRAWPVVLACFFTATFAWGFGFYGNSVYVAVLHDTRGWSLSLITGATTLYYPAGAVLLMYVHRAINGLQRASSLIILCAPRVREPLGVI